MPGFNTDPAAIAAANYRQAHERLLAGGAGSDWSALLDANNRAMVNGVNAQSAASGQSVAQGAAARAEENRRKLYELAQGRLGELRADPTDQLVMQALQDRATGKVNPYDATTRNALMTGQNEMAAHSAQNALEQLQRSGLQATDPAYQSRVAEINAARQAANQSASLNINQQANVANYGAQGTALGGLGSFNANRNSAITDQGRYLGGLYQQEQFREEDALKPQVLPNFEQFMQFMNRTNQGQQQQQAQGQQQQQQQQQARPASQQSQPGNMGRGLYGPPSPAGQSYSGATASTMRTNAPMMYQNGQPIIGQGGTAYRPAGTGYVQLSGQPQTRVTTVGAQPNMGYGQYGPPTPYQLAQQRYGGPGPQQINPSQY